MHHQMKNMYELQYFIMQSKKYFEAEKSKAPFCQPLDSKVDWTNFSNWKRLFWIW